MSKRVFLFDGTGLAYRAFYAIRELSTSKGFPTNAIFGFIRIFLKLFKEYRPEYAAVAFDVGKKTFRNKMLKTYKANRKPTPDSFKVQLPYIKKFLECLGVKVLEVEGYEADDVIATLAKKLSDEGFEVFVITSDKDMRQIIDEKVKVISISHRGGQKLYDLEEFRKEYGIEPWQIPEVFGLSGDQIDNIPGVPGIGEKTALKLIREYKNLEGLYEHLKELSPKRRETLEKFKEQAFLSRELAKVNREVPIEISPEELKVKEPDGKCLSGLLTELEMRSTAQELKKLFPGLELAGKEIERGKEVSLKEIGELLTPKDLFTPALGALIPRGEEGIVAAGKSYAVAPLKEALKGIKGATRVYTFNLKELCHRAGEEVRELPLFDVSLGYYLLNPLLKDYSPETLLKEHLKSAELPPLKEISHHTVSLGREVEEKLKKEGLYKLYREVEEPLSYVLYRMEKRGVLFDREYLEAFGRELKEEEEKLKKEIYEIVGEVFNLNSPKQLAAVLFEKLGLKPLKKTKSGYSTDVETLTTLALEGHRIAELILKYRKLSKIEGTFVKGILKHMDREGRVHTRFLQTATATGRLSSAEPNLQNLPVSDEISKKVRHAVIAPDGFNLVWADYSQVELRILAHISADERLIEAFREGKDIHSETAKHLFEVKEIDEKMRRVAKTVNFGIVYGMSPHGLSDRLGIPLKEAEEFIEKYFKNFPKVKEFIDSTLEEAYRKGYVRTLFGRKRPLPELRDSNYHVRSFGERAAVNAVIQGTAADVMKMAMVKLEKKLRNSGAYMVLQVHDEVVVEAPEEREKEVRELIKEVMEGVAELSVPLEVSVESGKRWS
ncbi:DNA polymerase I [Thermovibrio sp.]